jgi:peptide/nickel transport system permease protein
VAVAEQSVLQGHAAAAGGRARRPRPAWSRNGRILAGGAIVILMTLSALLAPVISPFDPATQDLTARFDSPNGEHLLGTDRFGRDILSRALWGTRISLVIASVAVLIGLTAGTVLGLSGGYFGGPVERVLSRIVDILLAYPTILLALALMAILGAGLESVILAVGIATAPTIARLVRAETISVMSRDYVLAARASGVGDARIMIRHVLPNIASTIIVMASLYTADAVLVESSLSFLGVGVPPPTATWGGMLAESRVALISAPWAPTIPGVWIVVTVLAFNLLGDGLRDALDPRLNGKR